VVEHLPFPVLIRFLDEVNRVLSPGGMAIFETPNPDNVLVGSRNFYYDPTHHNPLPSDTLRFLTEARGLCRVEVLPLHPVEASNRVPEREGDLLAIKFNAAFYGPQDYAVIGRKA
ncbi:MAG: SAM-dependent methyltransferase, partial [Bryobacteraceae bacterium]